MDPKRIYDFFAEICKIPRESGNEKGISDYLVAFAKERKLEYLQDKVGNVVIRKGATKGMENSPKIVLQSHVDMVCEKNSDVQHDFSKDPIETYIEDGWMKAKGTTLGADDGIGVATELAILDSEEIAHGPIECLFTISEETGLDGARALSKDALTGDILINLDSEDEGEIFIGCAGGVNTVIDFTFTDEKVNKDYVAHNIHIKGLVGGHSGDDINKERANANQLLVRYLWLAYKIAPFQLCQIDGGNKHNAIAREATATIAFPADKSVQLKELFDKCFKDWKNEYKHTEPQMEASFTKVEVPTNAIDSKTALNLINALNGCPHGVLAMSIDLKGIVETSTNLASVKVSGNNIQIVTSQRSFIDSAMFNAAYRIQGLFEMAGAVAHQESAYPGWAPDNNSHILNVCVKSYEKLFGYKPIVRAIHAGLECGLFKGVYPNMDMISFGPTLRGVHSPEERLELSTVNKYWDLLLDVLKNA